MSLLPVEVGDGGRGGDVIGALRTVHALRGDKRAGRSRIFFPGGLGSYNNYSYNMYVWLPQQILHLVFYVLLSFLPFKSGTTPITGKLAMLPETFTPPKPADASLRVVLTCGPVYRNTTMHYVCCLLGLHISATIIIV